MNFRSAADGEILESNGASYSTTQIFSSDFPHDEEKMQTLVLMIYTDVSYLENNDTTFSLIKALSSRH